MIGALILGFLAGVIGRVLMPGDVFRHMSGPTSWLVSLVLGLVGAALGWLLFTSLLGIGDEDVFDLGGILSAVIGVLIVLPIAGFILRRTGNVAGAPRAACPAAELSGMAATTHVLADGNEIPLLGLGVWQVRDGRQCEDAVAGRSSSATATSTPRRPTATRRASAGR